MLDIDGAIELANRREFLCANSPKCIECETPQVQLTQYFYRPAEWKCRHCKTVFLFEPKRK